MDELKFFNRGLDQQELGAVMNQVVEGKFARIERTAYAVGNAESIQLVGGVYQYPNALDASVPVAWSTEDAAIATVNATGLITGASLGGTVVRMAAPSIEDEASANVTVVTGVAAETLSIWMNGSQWTHHASAIEAGLGNANNPGNPFTRMTPGGGPSPANVPAFTLNVDGSVAPLNRGASPNASYADTYNTNERYHLVGVYNRTAPGATNNQNTATMRLYVNGELVSINTEVNNTNPFRTTGNANQTTK